MFGWREGSERWSGVRAVSPSVLASLVFSKSLVLKTRKGNDLPRCSEEV